MSGSIFTAGLALGAALLLPAGAGAQPQAQEPAGDSARRTLETVVITGQYGPQSARQAVHPVRVISAERIAQMAAVDLGDVLANELNIRLSQDNILGQSLSVQGLSGENVKILIDGVPLIGRQNGNLDLSQINLLGIERVEIVEGPLSVSYGSNALAGVINLITRKSGGPGFRGQASVYGEQAGTLNGSFDASWRKRSHQLSFSGGRNFFDGWGPSEAAWPSFRRRVADTTRFQPWKPREQNFARLQYQRRLGTWQAAYRAEAFDERIFNRGMPRAPYYEVAFDDLYHTRRLDQSLSVESSAQKPLRFSAVAAYNHYVRSSNSYRKDLTTLESLLTTGPGDQDTSIFTLWMSRGTLSSRQKGRWYDYELGYDLIYETAFGQRIESRQQVLGDYALFATAELRPWSWLTLRPGLRYAYNTAYDAPLTPSLNLRASRGSSTLRLSYAQGFRAPSLKELYFYFVDINHNIVGNAQLKAEHSHHLSANLNWRKLGRKLALWELELAGFYNDLDNLITLAEIRSPEFTYVNIGRFQSLGGSLRAHWRWRRWQASAGASYTGRAQQLSEGDGLSPFAFYPEVNGNFSYTLPSSETRLSLFFKYQGRLPGFRVSAAGEIEEQYVEAYSLADLTLIQPLARRRLTATLGVKNLMNVTNVGALLGGGAHNAGGSSLPVATGRTYFAKLDLPLGQLP